MLRLGMAGIPNLGDSYRDGDIPVNRNNWSATTYSNTRIRNDVDGDGKSFLLRRSYAKGWNFLWRHAPDRRNLVHLMDGEAIKARGKLRPTEDTWQVA